MVSLQAIIFPKKSLKTFNVFRTGARLGKGNGFNDLEWGILCELGVVDERTKVATTVHDVQVLELPHFLQQQHDLPVDIICTPAKTSKLELY